MSDLTSQYIIAQEEHDYNKKYEEGTIVKHTIDDNVIAYIAKKNVPQFISILNKKYWKKVASTSEGAGGKTGLSYGGIINTQSSIQPDTTCYYIAEESGFYQAFGVTVNANERVQALVYDGSSWDVVPLNMYNYAYAHGKFDKLDDIDATLTEIVPSSASSSNKLLTERERHFKGWFNSLAELKAAHTATEGDSAYVKDASPATTWSIYVYDATATTDNYWADSGTDADTSNVQTFASGEEVNTINIAKSGSNKEEENSIPTTKKIQDFFVAYTEKSENIRTNGAIYKTGNITSSTGYNYTITNSEAFKKIIGNLTVNNKSFCVLAFYNDYTCNSNTLIARYPESDSAYGINVQLDIEIPKETKVILLSANKDTIDNNTSWFKILTTTEASYNSDITLNQTLQLNTIDTNFAKLDIELKGISTSGTNDSNTKSIRERLFTPVIGGTNIYVYHKDEINIRLCQYDKNYNFIKSIGYTDFEGSLMLDANTSYVRICGEYPTTVDSIDSFNDKDFGFYYKNSLSLNEKLLLTNVFGDAEIFKTNGIIRDNGRKGGSPNYFLWLIPNIGYSRIEAYLNAPNIYCAINFYDCNVLNDTHLIKSYAGVNDTIQYKVEIPENCKLIALSSSINTRTLFNLYGNDVRAMVDMKNYDLTHTLGIDESITSPYNLRSINKELALVSRSIYNNDYNNLPTPTVLTLAHCSDVHGGNSDTDESSNHFKVFVDFYKKYRNYINDAIVTGDLVWNLFSDPFDYWNNNPTDKINNVDVNTMLLTIGNHDTALTDNNWGTALNDDVYNKFISPYINNWGLTNDGHSGTNLYYYKDYSDFNIRLIVLCPFYDIDNQLNWLNNTLSDAKTRNMPVIIANHYMFKDVGNINNDNDYKAKCIKCNFTILNDKISNAGNTEAAKITQFVIAVGEWKLSGGEVICWITGHTHGNRIMYDEKYKMIMLNTSILGGNQSNNDNAMRYLPLRSPISRDTINFILFNVYSFDTTNKIITIMRFGCNKDIFGRNINTLAIRYDTEDPESAIISQN